MNESHRILVYFNICLILEKAEMKLLELSNTAVYMNDKPAM